MAVLPIVTGQDEAVLRTKTTPVSKVTKDITKLIKDMQATVKKAEGAGLAAPQIGQSLRLCLAALNGRMTPLINPEITWRSDKLVKDEEGCLSLPNMTVKVPRATEIIVKYVNEKGQEQERHLTDFDARVVQHEVDHLEGVLIVDYE